MRGYVNTGLEALGFTPTSKPASHPPQYTAAPKSKSNTSTQALPPPLSNKPTFDLPSASSATTPKRLTALSYWPYPNWHRNNRIQPKIPWHNLIGSSITLPNFLTPPSSIGPLTCNSTSILTNPFKVNPTLAPDALDSPPAAPLCSRVSINPTPSTVRSELPAPSSPLWSAPQPKPHTRPCT
jgi:hypothetical protein